MEDTHSLLMKKAGALLAKRAYSRGELKQRLIKIADSSSIEPVLDRLEQLKLLNDADYAYNFALCRMQQNGWGPAKVQGSLLRRHVEQAIVESTLQRVQEALSGDILIETCVRGYIGKKGIPSDLKSVRRLLMHLEHRGFDEDSSLHVLRRMIPADFWQRFETGD